MITAVVVEGRTQAEVAATYGVSKGWVSKLVARYREEGEAAFEPRSKRPKTSPNATPPAVLDLIVRLRKELTEEEIRGAIRKGCLGLKIFPVFCGSAFKHKGVQPLLDAVVDYLPSPLDIPPIEGIDPETDQAVIRHSDDSEPFAGLVALEPRALLFADLQVASRDLETVAALVHRGQPLRVCLNLGQLGHPTMIARIPARLRHGRKLTRASGADCRGRRRRCRRLPDRPRR